MSKQNVNSKLYKIIPFLLSFILFANLSYVYSLEVGTHEAINETVAKGGGGSFSLDNYLINNLGVSGGVNEFINNKKVFDWFKLGGRYEDKPPLTIPYTRSLNHFHNPLETWDNAGLETFQSSVIWAQDQGPFGSLFGGNYSWKATREYFYTALTGKDLNGEIIASTQSERDDFFGKTFRGVGQIMHLVEDASVPAHTRDDAHVIGYHYEKAVNKFRVTSHPAFTDAIANPVTFDPSILTQTPNPLAPIPIAKIFDTDQYISAPPNPAVTAGTVIGLSEYTNANFVSEGLLEANFQDFPYPQIEDTTITERPYTGALGTYIRQYYFKNCCGETNSGQGYLLSAVDYFDYWRQLFPLLSIGLPTIAVLDDNVYEDYASLLLPRAIGYSAGLLNYFFRGTLEITAPDENVYAIIDGSVTPHEFTGIKAIIRNSTPDTIPGEEIQSGILQAVAKYKIRPNYQEDLSNDPPTEAEMQGIEYSYSVSLPENISSLSSVTAEEFIFDFTSDSIPVGITDLYLQVIFKGTLGNEEDIAIAAGLVDMNEPQHFSTWNATDMVYLDGVLRTAEEIRNDPELLARVNEAENLHIDPYDVTTYVAFYPTTETPTLYNATYTPSPPKRYGMPPERYGRLIILTDMPDFYYRVHHESTTPPENTYRDFLSTGVINQENNGTFENTQVSTFRGIIQHFWSAYAWYYPDSAGIDTVPWPAPAIIEPYPEDSTWP